MTRIAFAFGALLAVVAQALATASPLGTAAVLVAYGVGAATVLTALALSTALATGALVAGLRRALPVAERVAGVLLLASGAYLVAYWLPVLTGAAPSSSVARISQDFSGRVSGLLNAHRGLLAALAVVLLGAGLALAAWYRRAPRAVGPSQPAECCDEETVAVAERDRV